MNTAAKAILSCGAAIVMTVVGVACGTGTEATSSGDSAGVDPATISREVMAQDQVKVAEEGPSKESRCGGRWFGTHESAGNARVLISDRVVEVGSVLFARIQTLTKLRTQYGLSPSASQLLKGKWYPRRIERKGLPIAYPGSLLESRMRSLSPCVEVPVSSSWHPGLYRIEFEVRASKGSEPDEDVPISAVFRVVAS
jgi:hypothetical protein